MTERPHWKEGREHFVQANVGSGKACHYSTSANSRKTQGGGAPRFPLWRSISFPPVVFRDGTQAKVGLEYFFEPSNLTLKSHVQGRTTFLFQLDKTP